MTDRHADDHEVANIVADRNNSNKKSDDGRKARARSPSQSPITVQKSEGFFATAEDREKWKSTGPKWTKNIEPGYFKKIEQQFEASVNGYGVDNGIELDTSGSADEEGGPNGVVHVGETTADRATVRFTVLFLADYGNDWAVCRIIG